jgi:hypothetical protein
MKTIRFFFKLLLPLGLMAMFFQGCYTQFATMREEDSSYRQEQQSVDQNDSTYYGEDNDNWQPHRYIGFSYYYPGWNSYWAWDYGCVYPTYWDPWYWGPAFYIGYSYYPHHWGYWYSYSMHDSYRHDYSSGQFMNRNSGYLRTGNNRQTGAVRSGYAGVGTTYNGRGETSRGNVTLPRTAGSGATQSGHAVTTRTSRNTSTGVTTSRQRGNWFSPNVQQPRHRDQSNTTINRTSRTGSSHSRQKLQSQGTTNGQSRSSQQSSPPSYSPRQSTRSSSPSSAPASRNNSGSGGSRQSGGSGRSR